MKPERKIISAKKQPRRAPFASDDFISPVPFLRDEFLHRKEKNAGYSLRAFARDMGMSHSLLSLVFSGKRALTLKQAHKISSLLRLPSSTEKEFLTTTLRALPENAKISHRLKASASDEVLSIKNVEIEKFRMIAEWYHLAILDLSTLPRFQSNSTWISKQLGITRLEVDAAIDRMIGLGILVEKNKVWSKAVRHIDFATSASLSAVRAYHRQMSEKAMKALDDSSNEAFQKRSVSGMSLTVDPNDLDDAKEMIEQFKRDFKNRFAQGHPTEVYQFNFQFFPLTQTSQKGPSS